MSKGEQKVAELLTKSDYIFEQEKTFKDLRQGTFRYDFWLPRQNILIEVDGEQHFHQNSFGQTRSEWLKTQGHDRAKNSYALANNITLYRIPYWEIGKLTSSADLFNKKFIVSSKWHNDDLRRIMKFD